VELKIISVANWLPSVLLHGWVIWPVQIVPEMTYKVSSGTLSLYALLSVLGGAKATGILGADIRRNGRGYWSTFDHVKFFIVLSYCNPVSALYLIALVIGPNCSMLRYYLVELCQYIEISPIYCQYRYCRYHIVIGVFDATAIILMMPSGLQSQKQTALCTLASWSVID